LKKDIAPLLFLPSPKSSAPQLGKMADVSEKQHVGGIIENVDTLEKPTIIDTKIVLGDEAFNQAMIKEPPKP
jgi:hypothetical protein